VQQPPDWPPPARLDRDTGDAADDPDRSFNGSFNGSFIGTAAVLRPPPARTPSPPAGPPVVVGAVPPASWTMSGPPARAVSGPPSRTSPVTGRLPFPGLAIDRPPAAGSTPVPARLVRGLVIFSGVTVLALALLLVGYLWALPVYRQTRTAVVVPGELVGLPKVTEPAAYPAPDPLADAIRFAGVDKPTVVLYLATDDPAHRVYFAGGTHTVWVGVGGDLDVALRHLTADLRLTGTAAVDPGGMGGVAECGVGRTGAVRVTVCGWQDHGTIGLLSLTNRTPQEGAVLLRAMRPALEHGTG